jgi:hypothetical protein
MHASVPTLPRLHMPSLPTLLVQCFQSQLHSPSPVQASHCMHARMHTSVCIRLLQRLSGLPCLPWPRPSCHACHVTATHTKLSSVHLTSTTCQRSLARPNPAHHATHTPIPLHHTSSPTSRCHVQSTCLVQAHHTRHRCYCHRASAAASAVPPCAKSSHHMSSSSAGHHVHHAVLCHAATLPVLPPAISHCMPDHAFPSTVLCHPTRHACTAKSFSHAAHSHRPVQGMAHWPRPLLHPTYYHQLSSSCPPHVQPVTLPALPGLPPCLSHHTQSAHAHMVVHAALANMVCHTVTNTLTHAWQVGWSATTQTHHDSKCTHGATTVHSAPGSCPVHGNKPVSHARAQQLSSRVHQVDG